jgi:hypothetical protein
MTTTTHECDDDKTALAKVMAALGIRGDDVQSVIVDAQGVVVVRKKVLVRG